jgi:endonuclease-3
LRTSAWASEIQEILNRLFPNPSIPLDHEDPYTLLIAVLLSAQSTDMRVNKTTPTLFRLAKTPYEMVKLPVEVIEEIIRPIGLSPRKAKAILSLSQDLITLYDGKVPATFSELEALDGVGHKTASVVLSQAFQIPAFPVDTHIHRCAARWGLSSGKSVVQTEADLKRIFPENSWNKLHLQIIYFARKYCPAKGHLPSDCPICQQVLQA